MEKHMLCPESNKENHSTGKLMEMMPPSETSIIEYIFPLEVASESFKEGWVALVKFASMSLEEKSGLQKLRNSSYTEDFDFTNRLRDQLIEWVSNRFHDKTMHLNVKYRFFDNNIVLLYI